jgi:hypothetical protein
MKTKQSWKPAGHSATKYREMAHRRGCQVKVETPAAIRARELKKERP